MGNLSIDKNDLVKMGGNIGIVLITIIISMTGFWMMIGREFVTRSEAETIVNQRVQSDIKSLQLQMDNFAANDNMSRQALQKNTEAIQGLQVQMASLNTTLEIMVRSYEKDRQR